MIIIVILAKYQKENAELMEVLHVYRNPARTIFIRLLSVETYAHIHIHTALKLLRIVCNVIQIKKEKICHKTVVASFIVVQYTLDDEMLPKTQSVQFE